MQEDAGRGPTPLLQEYASAAAHHSKESVRKALGKMVADPIRIPEALVEGFLYRITQQGAQLAFQSASDNSVNSQLGIEKLKRISCPTLIVWGMKDNLIPIEYYHIFRGDWKRQFLFGTGCRSCTLCRKAGSSVRAFADVS